jgi:CelD/BcsL family acetyltransferase involved in cellulose biosynthesis
MSLDTEILDNRERIDALVPEWHALAAACGEPLAAPAWVLTLSREIAGASETPRVVTVREGGQLIGLAPLCVDLSQPRRAADYRLVAGDMPRTTLLALSGREWEAAGAVAGALAQSNPRLDTLALESIPVATCWPIALAEQWPGRMRPLLRQYFTMSSPTVALTQGSFDAWLGAKSSNFRSQMRRMRRRFAEAGGTGRFSTHETLADDWAAMVQLHAGRWEGRGASSIVAGGAALNTAYQAIGHELLEKGEFRLRVLEIDGKPISVQLFAAIGSEVIYINGGWDEEFAPFKPSMLGILDAIEDAFARGERRMDLGPGAQPYKLRFADGTDPVAWWVLIPPGRRMPLALARNLPRTTWRELRDAAKRALPPERVDRLRELRKRLP